MVSGPSGVHGQHVLFVATLIFQEKEVVLCQSTEDLIALETGLKAPCALFHHVLVMALFLKIT